MSIKFRLTIMNFLQYAIWGAWLISLGAYLGGELSFSGRQIGSFFATMGIASLFMPAIMGIIADRWIPAQKLLGICHIIGAALLVVAAPQREYLPLYSLILCSVMFYMPTISLSNSVAYNALTKSGLDTVKAFPPIRVWGTVGFICAMIAVDLLGFAQSSMQLYSSAVLGFILGVYSFTLPNCEVSKACKNQSWVDTLGLRAFMLFKQKKMAIFFVFSMLLGVSLQITNAFANDYLTNHFGVIDAYKGTFGVEHANILISLSQMSETLCILLIPFFLKRFGIKNVMLISMFAWVLRFGLLGTGNPGDGVWMLVLSMLVYGVAFDFFNISGSLYVDKETDPSIRSSAQGVFMIMTNGFGAFLGSYAAGEVVDIFGWPHSWFIFASYALAVGILFAIVFKYKHNQEIK
ncbi:MAG: nucleoside permease [Bacteroides graminisolvens]|jgi:NHS family xanthosine MFS transporter|uniref:Nucleoside permease NupG n=2 Tax=root TaxID=1 RepID=A0A069D1T0_9BACE|nr:nucleoside permease [Bacteroides graminisolvens]MCD8474954.1 nucleoside permease [Bacteroides graminisolvens]MCD8572714.1 nucleoside permease [Bacteroides graminisolvens]MDD3211822.1 nucleoside permease [Bacteroides graminisolvens]MEA4886492.1 nucleoside permease [Bacteroides graminisolvens]GAK36305.1 nucleoside permease NupG [Bacteroides graminisolvens DSM 19988 = JCM 15093]